MTNLTKVEAPPNTMEREAIEFHDSVLARIVRTADQVRLLFEPAYVHRSSGNPARDAGTGWSVKAELTVFGAVECMQPSKLPCEIWDGDLRVDERELQSVVPVPFRSDGKIHLALELLTGEVVRASGNRVELSIVGTYEFVENVSAASLYAASDVECNLLSR